MTKKDKLKQCEEGDTYYIIKCNSIIETKIVKITHEVLGHYVYEDALGRHYFGHHFDKSLFKTYEEAKNELYKREKIKNKRQLLKEYERKLNNELNLKDHYIVK